MFDANAQLGPRTGFFGRMSEFAVPFMNSTGNYTQNQLGTLMLQDKGQCFCSRWIIRCFTQFGTYSKRKKKILIKKGQEVQENAEKHAEKEEEDKYIYNK